MSNLGKHVFDIYNLDITLTNVKCNANRSGMGLTREIITEKSYFLEKFFIIDKKTNRKMILAKVKKRNYV